MPPPTAMTACGEDDAIRSTGGWRREVEAATAYEPHQPRVYGVRDRWPVLTARLPARLPATRVLGLPGALVVGRSGWLVTPDQRAVTSMSWFESTRQPNLTTIRWTSVRRLRGRVLTLATMNGAKNFSHFLFDGIGRLAVSTAVGIGPDDVDWVIVPGFATPSAQRLLDLISIPDSKRVVPEHGVALLGDEIIAASMAGTTRLSRPSLPAYLRRLQPPGQGRRRIFISRPGGRRALVNGTDIEQIAREHGFEILDAMSVDLPSVLAEAEAVIGEHGAGLANTAFCRPGTRVVEILPSDHLQPYYYSLADAAGFDYSVVIGQSRRNRPDDAWGPSPHPVTVELDAFTQALRDLEA